MMTIVPAPDSHICLTMVRRAMLEGRDARLKALNAIVSMFESKEEEEEAATGRVSETCHDFCHVSDVFKCPVSSQDGRA